MPLTPEMKERWEQHRKRLKELGFEEASQEHKDQVLDRLTQYIFPSDEDMMFGESDE